eukprot:CAMPEP_0194318654 /NCGR_PEP_ID=MMETSP0171-20130528/15243_1 /TAXON_ID=218684 /ORGANISM="Corethron pennatum, Strain L29A3" /LENGTH=49 /DNA_ID= /DNA_START= /DNA_END= /DNA_ORIENTATION=
MKSQYIQRQGPKGHGELETEAEHGRQHGPPHPGEHAAGDDAHQQVRVHP